MVVCDGGRIVASLSPGVLRKHRARIFIETGTGWGGGVLVALCAGFFEKIYTVETFEAYFRGAHELYSSNSRVTMIRGDSRSVLPEILKGVNERAVIWLDAHSPDEQNPVFDEMDAIARHPVKNHCIMVDDKRMWGCKWACWKDVTPERVMEKVLAVNPDYRITYEDSMNGPQDIFIADIP